MFILFVEFGHLGDREQDLLQADNGGWRWAQDLLVQGAEGGRPHTGENGWMDAVPVADHQNTRQTSHTNSMKKHHQRL